MSPERLPSRPQRLLDSILGDKRAFGRHVANVNAVSVQGLSQKRHQRQPGIETKERKEEPEERERTGKLVEKKERRCRVMQVA